MAQAVLARGGAVYGAAYGGGMRVFHREAGTLAELEGLKKTKYVQSDMGGIYKKIQQQLEGGRWVLFCGTPCQVRALQLFL